MYYPRLLHGCHTPLTMSQGASRWWQAALLIWVHAARHCAIQHCSDIFKVFDNQTQNIILAQAVLRAASIVRDSGCWVGHMTSTEAAGLDSLWLAEYANKQISVLCLAFWLVEPTEPSRGPRMCEITAQKCLRFISQHFNISPQI